MSQLARGPLTWLAAALLLAALAWQGHRVAHLLPQLEHAIASLGAWGPVAYVGGVVLLAPLLVPDTIFGIAAGVVFGLGAGLIYYFGAVYIACMLTMLLARRWLRGRVLAALAHRPALASMAKAAERHGLRLTIWVRLVPFNPAAVSYALGAAGVPVRAVAIGTLAMLPHMLLTVYVGAAAAHVTRMAGASHAHWTAHGIALLLGLGVCAGLVMEISAVAVRHVRAAAGAESGPEEPP